jgi:hypothetical protein
MSRLLSSVRRKLLGETRAIPLGVAASITLGLLTRAVLPQDVWESVGAFALVGCLIFTLIRSLPLDDHRVRRGANPGQRKGSTR